MNKYTQPTEAVREFQKIHQLINRRMDEDNRPTSRQFWANVRFDKISKIAQTHSLTIFDLVHEWEAWDETVQRQRQERVEA
jgi:hypothetical protein